MSENKDFEDFSSGYQLTLSALHPWNEQGGMVSDILPELLVNLLGRRDYQRCTAILVG